MCIRDRSLCVNGLLAAVMAALLLAFTGPLMGLMQVPAELMAEAGAYLRITALAVSYTHLDVYKRQAFLRSSPGTIRRSGSQA